MRDHLNSLLAEVGESFDDVRSDVRRLGRYAAELEELIESYRAFVADALLPRSADRQIQRKLLKRTLKLLGPELINRDLDESAPRPTPYSHPMRC